MTSARRLSAPVHGAIPPASLRDVSLGWVWALAVPALAVIAFLSGVKLLNLPGSVITWVLPIAALAGALGLGGWLVGGRGWGLRELGFTRPTRSLWHLLWEIPAAVIASLITAATVGPMVGLSPSSARATGSGLDAGPAVVAAFLVSSVVLIPLVEEVYFRRILLGWLAARMPVWAAVVLCGVLFGLIHIAPAMICYVLPLGLALAGLRVWHGSLWASLALHAANNALVAGVVLAALR